MKHTKRWLALILAIALVAANASYQLGTSLYASEDQSAIETQSEEAQKQEAVQTEEPKSTGSAQVEEVQNEPNTSDTEENQNAQADAETTGSENIENNSAQAQKNAAATQESNDDQPVVVNSASALTVNEDGSVSGSGYDSITLNVNTDGIQNQNNTAFNIRFDTGNLENNKKISASNLNPSEGIAKNLKKNNGGTFTVNGFAKNAFTITVSKVDGCKNSVKTEATVDVANGTVTLIISDYYESSYTGKTFENPTASSLGSVNDFAVFANNYKNHVDMEGNIAVKNMLLANTNGGNSHKNQARDFNLNYVENFVMDSMKSEFFREADPLIVGDDYEINTQDSNYNLKLKSGAVVNLGPSDKVKDVVNIKNSSYKIDFNAAMDGLKQYADKMYGKADTEGVKFKAENGSEIKKSECVKKIACKENVNNIIHVKASELQTWADNVEITNLGTTGSVTFNIEYDVAKEFTKPHFTIDGKGTNEYNAEGGRILLNFGTQAGTITFGELYSGTILAPNATVAIYTTHNGSVYADTVENISGEIHKNPWKPGKEEDSTSVNVYLKGTKTLDGASAEAGSFKFLLQQTDESGNVMKDGYQQEVTNGDAGRIAFDTITYTTPGTYYYNISEVAGGDANINYDQSVYQIMVTVDENMLATVTYMLDGQVVNADTGAAFSNTSIVREVKTSLNGYKTLNGQLSTAAFQYQIVEVADENGTEKADAKSWTATNKTTGDAKIDFPEFTYNTVGDYYYKVTEINENAEGIDYDSSVYIAHVVVAADAEGSLTTSTTYKKYAGPDQITAEAAQDAEQIAFANKTLKAQVTFAGNKSVNQSEARDAFTFKLVEKDETGKEIKTIDNKITNQTGEGENGAIQFPTMEYNKAGTHYYEISENTQSGNSVTYDKTVYTAVVKVEKGSDGLVATTKYYKNYNYADKSKNQEITGNLDFANTMETSVRLHGTKMLDQSRAEKDAFAFEITQVDADGTAVADGYTKEVKNGEKGAIETEDILFDAPGTYYYKITEKAGDKANIKYDDSFYTAVVVVEKNGLNLSVQNVKYYKNVKGSQITEQTNPADNMTFQNKTKHTDIQFSGKKVLIGKDQTTGEALKLQEGQFTFDIAEANADGTVKNGAAYQTVQNQADGTIIFPTYKYKTSGDYYYRISEQQSQAAEVAGTDYDQSIYLVHVNVSDNEDNFEAKIQSVTKYADQKAMDAKNGTTVTEITNNDVATFTNRVRYGSATFAGNKTLDGNPATEAFRYTVVEKTASGALMSDGYKSGIIKNDASGNIQFSDIIYTKAGTYYYEVKEIDDSADTTGITYDKTVYTAVVTVTKDDSEEGTGLSTTVRYYKDYDYRDKTGTEADQITFHNQTIQAATSFTGKKYVDGELAANAGAFSFTLTRTDADYRNALTGSEAYSETVSNDANGNIVFTEISYNAPGDYYYTISENVPVDRQPNMYYDEAVYRAKVTVNSKGLVTVEKSVVPYDGYEDGSEPIEDEEEFLMFNNYTLMTMSMNYGLATIKGTKTLTGGNLEAGEFRFGLYDANGALIDTTTNDASGKITFRTIPYYVAGTYTYTVKEIDELGENNASDIEYDPSTYTVTVYVDDNMDTSITYEKDGVNVDNLSFENKMSVTAAVIDPSVTKVLNNAELQPGEFTFQLFDENGQLIDTKKNTDSGSVLFDSIVFDKVGDYSYTIKELIPENPGQITYDGREIKVNVKVTKNTDTGNLEAAVTYLEDNAPTENPTFVNIYNPISIRVQKTSKDGSKDPLKGATYALYKVLGEEGRDILIGTQVSDANGYMTFENVEPGTYYFKEVSAPAGHTVDEYATKKFTVSADGKINAFTTKNSKSNISTQNVQFSMAPIAIGEESGISLFAEDNKQEVGEQLLAEAPGVSDEVTKLSVSKLDYTNHEFVAGAKMQILEKSSGNIVAEWTTGNSAESFERKLNVDTPYILREVSAPEGYDLAKDTEFVIDAYGILSITSGPDAEKTSDTSLSLYDKKLGVTNVTTNTKENHNQKFVDVVKTVKTGDTAKIGLFAVLAVAAAVVVIIMLRRRKNS